MGVITGIFIALLSIFLILFLRSLTTLFHELGHAIPALVYTSNPVHVYIGTYGDTTRSFKISFGRLHMYIQIFILDWKIGMCQHSGRISVWQNIIIILGGPFASLLISIPLMFYIRDFGHLPAIQTLMAVFMLAAIIDFLVNIIPMQLPINMHDGSVMYNDGTQLVKNLKRLNLPQTFFELEEYSLKGNHDKVISVGLNMIDGGSNEKEVYKTTIESLLHEKEFVAALALFERMSESHKLAFEDFKQVGLIQKKLNDTESAMKYFNHCLHLNFKDVEILTEKGIIEQERGEYHAAYELFDSAIHYEPSYLRARIHRAQILIKLKEYDSALIELKNCDLIDAKNPDVLFSHGLYYEAIAAFQDALKYYEEAELLGVDHHGIEYRIATVRNEIR